MATETKKEIIFFENSVNFDTKKILNVSDKKVSKSILDAIETDGLTLEMIDKIDLPIFKYKTQVTVHGLFDELKNNYIFGYKNLFQNKNKSIGVKYTAIDEIKRQAIKDKLKCLKIGYHKNSNETVFFKQVRVFNEQDYKTGLEVLKPLFDKIDTSLFYGDKQLVLEPAMGCKYLSLYFTISAIYEANISLFLNTIGATNENILAYELELQKRDLELKNKWELEKQNNANEQAQILKDRANELELLNKYQLVDGKDKTGTFLKYSFDYKNKLRFEIYYIYELKGKKKLRYNRNEFDNLNEALTFNIEQRYSDNIWNGKLKAYQIN